MGRERVGRELQHVGALQIYCFLTSGQRSCDGADPTKLFAACPSAQGGQAFLEILTRRSDVVSGTHSGRGVVQLCMSEPNLSPHLLEADKPLKRRPCEYEAILPVGIAQLGSSCSSSAASTQQA
eukprot:2449650-Amphidinium_carterae.1